MAKKQAKQTRLTVAFWATKNESMSSDAVGERYDFFLSYRGVDFSLAQRVYQILTDRCGYRVYFQPVDIKLGEMFPQSISEGINHSDRVLALVTPDYFHGSWWTAVAEFRVAAATNKLIMLRFRDATIPLEFSQITHLKCTNDLDHETFEPTVVSAGKLQQVPASQLFSRIVSVRGMPQWKGKIGSELVGREIELRTLHNALDSNDISVICLIAGGGYGKSSLVSKWLAQVLDQPGALHRPEIQTAFAYSFYRQGSDPKAGAVSSKDFFESAVASILGVDIDKVENSKSLEKHCNDLLGYLRGKRFILVIDGLEPLQVPEGADNAGAIREDERVFQGFLQELAQIKGTVLTIITSRVMPTVFKGPRMDGKFRVIPLGPLDESESRRVLCDGGLSPDDLQTARLAVDSGGHPLLLALLGPAVNEKKYDVESFAAHRVLRDNGTNNEPETISRFVNSYMIKLSKDPSLAQQAAAVLRAVCLFDRPMPYTELHKQLLSQRNIAHITAPFWTKGGRFDENDFKHGCELLRSANLLTISAVETSEEPSPRNMDTWKLEVHPLVQAGVQGGILATMPEDWRRAHKTIWLAINKSVWPLQPSKTEDLRILYRAAPHGVLAGEGFWAGWLYAIRCLRFFRAYGTNQHGMIREDLVFMSHLFNGNWQEIRNDIKLGDSGRVQAYVWSGVLLIGVNRGEIGRDLMEKGLKLAVETGQPVTASRTARNLAFAHAIVGNLEKALKLAEQAVKLLDQPFKPRHIVTEKLIVRRQMMQVAAQANRGAILHYRGDLTKAEDAFVMAEQIQGSWFRKETLHGFWGYHRAQLLIDNHKFDDADAKIDAALVNARKFLKWGEGIFAEPILQLAYAKSRVRRADLTGDRRDWPTVQGYAVSIRGQFSSREAQLKMDWLMPTFLTTLSGVARLSGEPDRAEAHLEEARRHLDRGSAVLFESDVSIEHVRLLDATGRRSQAVEYLSKLRTERFLLSSRLKEIDVLEHFLV